VRRIAAALVLAGCAAAARPAEAQSGRVLVMPFENVARDNRIFWLTEASAVLLVDDLNALGMSAITREERRAAFDRLQVPPAAALTDATVIRIGQIVGASQVVVGTLRLEDEILVVQARSIELESGRIRASITERGTVPDLFATFERIARRIAPASSRSPAEVEGEHPPVAVFENYVKGLLADTPATAVVYLNTALKADPTFARARLALWDVYTELGDQDRALAAVLLVQPGSRFSRQARFRVGLSQLALGRYDEASVTYTALARESPTATVFNNLGIVELRRGGAPAAARAVTFFARAAQTDPSDPDYFFNLGYACWLSRDLDAAVYWLREAVRRDPADGDAHFVLGAALETAGRATEAARERDLARRLSFRYEAEPGGVPGGLERVKPGVELPHARDLEETLALSGQREHDDLARFHLERGARLYEEERDREALAELSRTLFLSPYHAQAHVLVARIHLRGGRVQEAIDALKISVWSAETAEARALLAAAYLEADEESAARTEAERALALDPASAGAREVLEKIGPP
jgi:tetratricopeptide (TPR) repeat protein/TolB-like protein